jgi:hypothetical protein
MVMSLPIGPALTFKVGDDQFRLTDHNRSELSISPDRIEYKKRMADATLRTFFVAQKQKFKVSWTKLPKDSNQTIDGYWGALSMKSFYESTLGSFELILTYGNNTPGSPILVMFDGFEIKLKSRGRYTDLYDIDLALEEV